MNSRAETYARRLEAAHRLERLKKYLSLCGIGFALWANDLWQSLFDTLDSNERKLHRSIIWRIYRVFNDLPTQRVSPLLELINSLSFIVFIAFSLWLLYWAYMDTYVRRTRGESTWSFPKKVTVGLLANVFIYFALTKITQYASGS